MPKIVNYQFGQFQFCPSEQPVVVQRRYSYSAYH